MTGLAGPDDDLVLFEEKCTDPDWSWESYYKWLPSNSWKGGQVIVGITSLTNGSLVAQFGKIGVTILDGLLAQSLILSLFLEFSRLLFKLNIFNIFNLLSFASMHKIS